MGVPFVRPRVAELVFRVYDRPLHPDWFAALATRQVERAGGRVVVRLTRAGHVLTWTRGPAALTEVVASADQELPDAGRRLGHRLGAERQGRCVLGGGVRYQTSSHVEVLPPEQFLHVQEELRLDGLRKGLLCELRPDHRLGPAPLGVVIAEAVPAGLSVAAFHTYPDELAVVKTQSLVEWT